MRVKAAPVVAARSSTTFRWTVGATQDISLSGCSADADGDTLTVTAGSSNTPVGTVTVAGRGSEQLTVDREWPRERATITVTAR